MSSQLSVENNESGTADTDERVLFSEVVTVLNELGHYNRLTNTYQLNTRDHNSCLRELIRFLRNDQNNFLVRRQMGISNIVDNDLLPIVEQHTVTGDCKITETGKSIVDKVIRLLVDLTNPTILHYKDQQIPRDDKYEMQIYMELQSLLGNYKLAFAIHKRFWIILSKHLTRILELDNETRQLEDDLMLERIIVLIRNVLHIPVMASNDNIDEDTNSHDRIIEQISSSGILDIIQYMSSSEDHIQYIFHIIEIIQLMFREQDAEFLAKSVESDRSQNQGSAESNRSYFLSSSRSQYEQEIDRAEFNDARNRDRQQYLQIMSKIKADDYTRFNGSAFVVKNLKSISDRDMICHRAFSNPEKALDLNKNKLTQRRARNRQPMTENVGNNDSMGIKRIHRTNRHLRSILYEFCVKFLSESYNNVMLEVRSNLIRGHAQEHDETYYLWVVQFFMEFSRCRPNASAEDKYKQVYQTISISTFHYLQTLVDNYLEHLSQKRIFKNELTHWSKRLHLVLRTYRELLYTLSSLERLNYPEASKMCHRIKTDLFTEPEYRELLLQLLQSYHEEQMSKAFLRDLIETNHIFLKMLDYHAKISYNFKVKVKKRKIKKRKANKKSSGEESSKPDDEIISPEDVWIDIMEDVADALNSDTVAESINDDEELKHLFDPLTEKSTDEQKLDIMRTIKKLLMKKDCKRGVGLFRQARAVYSSIDESNVFGDVDISVEDELIALNGILMTEFPPEEIPEEDKDEEEVEDEENDIQDNSASVQEKNFCLDDTIRRYANPNVIRSYRILLKYYKTNSTSTNHAIVRMLYRIAVNLKMIPMFYNLAYFVIFEQILEDPNLQKSTSQKKPNSVIEELASFAHYVLYNFFKLLAKYPKISAEICFAANSRDSYAMEYGFEEEYVKQSMKVKKANGWSEEQELELEVLYKEYKDKVTKENDIVDLIQQNLIDDTKTRRQIIIQLKRMDLIKSNVKKNSWKGPSWTDEENEELRNLYEQFKNETDFDEIVQSKKMLLSTTIEMVESDSQKSLSDNKIESNDNEENDKVDLKKNRIKRMDIIDCMLENLSTKDQRNRRQLIRQLKLLNIYDHTASKKWSNEQIENLRSLFCNLFVDFKTQLDEPQDVDDPINKENFLSKLMILFDDKTKTQRQIIRQLKKMGLEQSLQTIGISKPSDKKVDKSQSKDLHSDSSDEEEDYADNEEEEGEDELNNQRISNKNDNDEVVVQYESDDDISVERLNEEQICKDTSVVLKDVEVVKKKKIFQFDKFYQNSKNEMDNSKKKKKRRSVFIEDKDDDDNDEVIENNIIENIPNSDEETEEISNLNDVSFKKLKPLIDSDDESDNVDIFENNKSDSFSRLKSFVESDEEDNSNKDDFNNENDNEDSLLINDDIIIRNKRKEIHSDDVEDMEKEITESTGGLFKKKRRILIEDDEDDN